MYTYIYIYIYIIILGIVPIFCEAMFKEIDEKRKEQQQEEKKTEFQVNK